MNWKAFFIEPKISLLGAVVILLNSALLSGSEIFSGMIFVALTDALADETSTDVNGVEWVSEFTYISHKAYYDILDI